MISASRVAGQLREKVPALKLSKKSILHEQV